MATVHPEKVVLARTAFSFVNVRRKVRNLSCIAKEIALSMEAAEKAVIL